MFDIDFDGDNLDKRFYYGIIAVVVYDDDTRPIRFDKTYFGMLQRDRVFGLVVYYLGTLKTTYPKISFGISWELFVVETPNRFRPITLVKLHLSV